MKRKKWIQKCEVDQNNLPMPTQIVSNEEFAPIDQTIHQKKAEHRLIEIASESSKKLGISRRKFLASTGGMAAIGDSFAAWRIWRTKLIPDGK